MSSNIIAIIGYLALGINLYSMSCKGELRLRLISSVANAIYIIYGILIGAIPIVIGGLVAVILHVYRLKENYNLKSNSDKKTNNEL